MRRIIALLVPICAVALAASSCSGSDDEAPPPKDAGSDVDAAGDAQVEAEAAALAPPGFERFCTGTAPWRETLTPATLGTDPGEYQGSLSVDFAAGVQEGIKVVPAHPFAAKSVRVAFAKGSGKARIRVMNTFGRSYPASYADPSWLDAPEVVDLVPPIEVDVADADPDTWLELPIPETLLLPTQHYMIVYEHIAADPRLAVEKVASGDMHRSLVFDPAHPADPPTGFDGNYRMQLMGDFFCAWQPSDFQMQPMNPAFSDVASGFASITDLNGDGHDDVVLLPKSGERAWLGDGKGGFTPLGFDPFPDTPAANFVLFADLDNDGDEDAFASQYVQTDADNDKSDWDTDCDQTDAAIHPGAAEVPGNGKDDDCDGKADDGTDTSDADGDGVTIAAGDCDDTQKDVYPGAPELADSRDNDCNGKSDEIFAPMILTGDGTGHFTAVSNPDVEVIGPSSAAAFGDGNGDAFLDLYAGYWLVHYPDFPTVPSRYYEGAAGAQFTDAQTKAGLTQQVWRPVYGVLWTDWNNDGNSDIYVSNYQLSDNLLWQNQGGTFVDVANSVNAAHDDVISAQIGYPGGHSFGSDSGDIDNDGDMDIYVPDISHPRVQPGGDPSMLLVNQGAPNYAFLNERKSRGLLYDEGDVNAVFGDYDNDGDLDLYVVSTYESHYGRMYRNDGDAGFVDVTYETGVWVHLPGTAVWTDVDEDGDLDLVITSSGMPFQVQVFENTVGQLHHFIELDLRGTTANRDAVGARISVKAGGVTRIREVKTSARHQGSHWAHFGLGDATSIEELTVRWPGGTSETITGASIDGRFAIVQGSGTVSAP